MKKKKIAILLPSFAILVAIMMAISQKGTSEIVSEIKPETFQQVLAQTELYTIGTPKDWVGKVIAKEISDNEILIIHNCEPECCDEACPQGLVSFITYTPLEFEMELAKYEEGGFPQQKILETSDFIVTYTVPLSNDHMMEKYQDELTNLIKGISELENLAIIKE